MYFRKKIKDLEEWKLRSNRKPLILRGARQVGKTSLINMFAKEFDLFISLNLEIKSDKDIFEKNDDLETILQILFLKYGETPSAEQTVLIFIDEIQNSSKTVALLRYFYELHPEIYVIATGSLLESLLSKNISFPVGRVEYLFLHPFSFEEFIIAKGNKQALKIYNAVPFPKYGHQTLLKLFNEYALIGGMPEVVSNYLLNQQVVDLNPIFDSLLITYMEDVEKYAKTDRQREIIRHLIQNAFLLAGQRIKFEGFANSNYKSKDVSECFRILERTFLLKLIYPTVMNKIPVLGDKKKSPKLQVLDTGIVNKMSGLQVELLNNKFIDSVYDGKIAEHIVGQELLAEQVSTISKTMFWVKEKKQSNAEIDFVITHDNYVIPVEVKSGKTGRLRSLMEFIDLAPHPYAVRIYSGELKIDRIKTIRGKEVYLLNLPLYLTGKINEYIKILVSNNTDLGAD